MSTPLERSSISIVTFISCAEWNSQLIAGRERRVFQTEPLALYSDVPDRVRTIVKVRFQAADSLLVSGSCQAARMNEP
jgi:hypothetical protein